VLSRSFSLGVVLAVLWLLLSGYFHEPILLAMGAVSVVCVVLIARRMDVVDREGHPIHLGMRGLLYWPWLLKEIVKSSTDVAKVILRRRMPIHPSLITVRGTQRTELGLVVFANSITLTPGTVTIALEGDLLTVHCLTTAAASGWEESEMNKRVSDLEGGS
jgi:multicomponent Na+:H+ antiporter subunit E